MKAILSQTSLNDEYLVKRISKTNEAILSRTVFKRYESIVYNKYFDFLPDKAKAMKLTKDVFLKCFKQLASFKAQTAFSYWLYALTYQFCIVQLANRKPEAINKKAPTTLNHDLNINNDSLLQLQVGRLKKALVPKLRQKIKWSY